MRLTGLGDEEYLWEPVAGCWSIRRRGEATTPRAYGPGEWVLDQGAPDIPSNEYAEVHDPFVAVLAGANLEFVHHMAEIALLRDLARSRFGPHG